MGLASGNTPVQKVSEPTFSESKNKDIMKTITQLSPEYITVKEAAEILAIEPGTVRQLLWQKKFTTYKLDVITRLSREEVLQYKKDRRA